MRKRGFALGPVFDNVTDNFVADDLSGFESGKVSGIIAGDYGLEAVGSVGAGRLAVVIAYGAKNEDALEIDAGCLTQESEGLHGAGVFHGGNHVVPFSAGVVARPGVGPLIQFGAVPEGAQRERVATGDEWRL